MQNKIIRQNRIKKVMDNLACLSGSDFEQLCYFIGEHFLKKNLQKRGQTIFGHPVGYTVDAYSDNLNECIECSTDKDYFEDFSEVDNRKRTKIEKDILHVFSKSEAPQHILLFSNQVCTPSQATNVCNYVDSIEKDKNVEISWFDSRKLSEYVIDNVLEDNLYVEKIKDFVPVLDEILMISINNISMPDLPDNYVCPVNLDILKEKLYRNRCLYIYGISGIGKSLLSIELAKTIQSNFVSLYYVDGTKINSVSDLEATELFGTTGKINILGNLRRPGTLLIIDDLKSDYDKIVNKLKSYCDEESCVILTSQTIIKDENLCYKLDFPSEEQSKYILEYNAEKCPQKIISIINQKTNFHPLLLAQINQMVQELNDWNFVENELKHCPDFEIDLGVTVCEHLLRHYLPVLQKEFDVISWLNCQYINKDLLRKIIGISGYDKMKKRALIYEASGYSLKVHDIIFLCIKRVSNGNSDYKKEFLEHFKEHFLVKSANYYQAIHLHQEKILEIAKQEMAPGISLYLYLDIWSNDKHELISKISVDKYMTGTYTYDEEDLYALYSVVQLIECSYKTYKGKWKEKMEYARKQVKLYEKLINLGNAHEEFITYVKHHLGKLYVFIQDDSAIEIFSELIEHHSDMYESKLQLAKLLIKGENAKEEGERLLCNIIDAYLTKRLPSMTIVLAAYEAIKNTQNSKLVEYYFIEKFDEFSEALREMALEKFDQPYRVLANVSKVYTYQYPEQLRKLVKSIPFPSVGGIDKRYAFAIAETYKECGKSILWESEASDILGSADIYFEQAENFYSILTDTADPYKIIMHAENLNKLKKYNEAVKLLRNDEVFSNPKNRPFREYRYAEALYGLGEGYYEQALLHINNAIKSENVEKYVAAFEELKGCILLEINPVEDEWKECFELAIKSADSEKYKKELEKKYHECLGV